MVINKPLEKKGNIKKITIEWIAIFVVFIFSFFNTFTLLISLILMMLLLKQREIGAIKIINLVTLRTIINPAIAISIGELQNIKWLILFGCSLYLWSAFLKIESQNVKKIKPILLIMALFTFYNILVAFIFSSLPIVATFKLISYVFIFLGTLIGIAATYRYINWLKWMYTLLLILMVTSVFSLIFPSISYIRNGFSFQGLTNQPNMFGIVSVLFLALFLTYVQYNKTSKFYFLTILILTYGLSLLSLSRTSIISLTVLLIIYYSFRKINDIKIVVASIFTIAIVYITMTENLVKSFIIAFLYKGNDENILASRTNQLEGLTERFLQNPWFGNGFAVPVLSNKSFIFSTEFVVEPGNLIISVLSYSGIFGFLIFLVFLIKVFTSSNAYKKLVFLPVGALLVSMGEMVFFSSNNIGIWTYMFISIYIIVDNKKEDKENNKHE